MIAIFRGLPMLAQVGSIVVVLGLVVGGYKLWEHRVWKAGWDAHAAAVAAQDQEAINASNEGAERVRACRESGGVWRAASGKCEGR